MEKVEIGVALEAAIIFERHKDEQSNVTYTPYKVAIGRYDNYNETFLDRTGNTYVHISTATVNDQKYSYGGKVAIPNCLLQELSFSLENFISSYFQEFNEWTYEEILDEESAIGNIICLNKNCNERIILNDERIKFEEKFRELFASQKITYMDPNTGETKEITLTNTKLINNSNPKTFESNEDDIDFESNEFEEMVKSEIKTIKSEDKIKIEKTPQEIVEEVKKYVKGQDETIKTVVTNLYQKYNYENGKKQNMILVGPSGCGKTYIFETLSKILDIPVLIYSVPGLSQSGYIGSSVDDILVQLLAKCSGDPNKSLNSIIILDEIDKLSQNNGDSDKGGVATIGVQEELLKMIEGTEKMVSFGTYQQKVVIDTKNILFILTGAFQELFEKKQTNSIGFNTPKVETTSVEPKKLTHDDIVEYGLKRELVGRSPILCNLNKLTEEDIYNIVVSEKGELLRTINLLKEAGVECLNYQEFARKIAKKTIKKNIGARGIDAVVTNIFIEIEYEIFNNIGTYNYLILGDNILDNNKDYKLLKEIPLEYKENNEIKNKDVKTRIRKIEGK